MDILKDPLSKIKYHKYKIRVKLWESDFMEKYGRKPNKNDIKAADVSIREAYKIYWKLKTEALEETFTDVSFKDTEKISDNLPELFPDSKIEMYDNNKPLTNISINLKNTCADNQLNVIEGSLRVFENSINVQGAWDHQLKNEQNCDEQDPNISINKSFQLSHEKFQSFKFSKRNPRRSYSKFSVFEGNKESSETNQLSKENLEEIADHCISKTLNSIYDENLRVTNEKQILMKSTNTVQQLIENSSLSNNNKELNKGWLSRCIKNNILEVDTSNILQTCDNTYSSLELPKNINSFNYQFLTQDIIYNESDSENEDYIHNSDSDKEHPNKRLRNDDKIRSDTCLQPTKKMCLNNQKFSYEQEGNATILNNHATDIHKLFITNKCTKLLNIEKSIDPYTNKFNCNSNKQNYNIKYVKDEFLPQEKKKEINQILVNSVDNDEMLEIKTDKFNRNKNITGNDDNVKICCKKSQHDEVYNCHMNSFNAVHHSSENMNGLGNFETDSSYQLEVPQCEKAVESAYMSKYHSPKKHKFQDKKVSGKLNENYIRLNLKKKVFVRGRKSFNFSKYKKNQWKQRKKDLDSNESNLELLDSIDKNEGFVCFKCNGRGHYSRQCKNVKSDNLLSFDSKDDISSYSTLQEVERVMKSKNTEVEIFDSENSLDWRVSKEVNNEIISQVIVPDEFKKKIAYMPVKKVNPIYMPEENKCIRDTPLEVLLALKKFGHSEFREGQEHAIMRILSGQSTLVTLATGSGKSLCYQLPAYMYAEKSASITIVVSPLVSLMDDQVSKIPSFLSAACLHMNQSSKLRTKIINMLKEKEISILFVSPETIVAGNKMNSFESIFCDLPPIAFACIDEAHCISQWSHNFRPSYLMVCKVLKEKFGIKTFLGLTATATKSTILSIINHLNIPDNKTGVITEKPLPSNLNLTISQDEQREKALIKLLCSENFVKYDSLIVYCTRREECDRIARLLHMSLQEIEPNQVNRKQKHKTSPIAESYHAGLSAHRRRIVQEAFMNSETRIVVATVAFGMGINKSNIRSVIHFNMPANFESYVQEIGRAGRDGYPAHCHMFVSPQENSDEFELRRHINANTVDRHTIRRLLQRIFISCYCVGASGSNRKSRCMGHEVAFGVEETVRALDISEETISTLLCYLELHPKHFITALPSSYMNAKVTSHNGPEALKIAARSSRPLATAAAMLMKKGAYSESDCVIEFSVIDIATAIGWDSGLVKHQLKNLEMKSVNNTSKQSMISVNFNTLGFRVEAAGDFTNEELDEALESLYKRNRSQRRMCYQQLKSISTTSRQFSFASINDCVEFNRAAYVKSENLKSAIRTYFELDNPSSDITESLIEEKLENEECLIADIRSLILNYKDNNFTGRSIARIFHGIQSPNYPAIVWSKCRFWRAHLTDDFEAICQLATKELLKYK